MQGHLASFATPYSPRNPRPPEGLRTARGHQLCCRTSVVSRATFDPARWALAGVAAVGRPEEGQALDLSTCALLIALLHAEAALPPVPA